MSQSKPRVALITGANAGIGKELARQLAVSGQVSRVYLACRNKVKAQQAVTHLRTLTGRSIFEVLVMDVSDPASVRAAVDELKEPVDYLFMNAGGIGGKSPMRLTKDGVTEVFAVNVLGHVVLLDSLIQSGKLTEVAVLVGSEAARGLKMMGIKKPVFHTSSVDEFASVCTGAYFHEHALKADTMLAYAQVKYVGAMWMASMARKHPTLRLLTVSPGSTAGTDAMSSMPAIVRFLLNYIAAPLILPLLGMIHSVQVGSGRLATAAADPRYLSGHFYASRQDKVTGPVVDQRELIPDLNNQRYAENADEAVHRFVETTR